MTIPARCHLCGTAENPRASVMLAACTECGELVCTVDEQCSEGDIGWEGNGWLATCRRCLEAAEQHDADERDGVDRMRGTL